MNILASCSLTFERPPVQFLLISSTLLSPGMHSMWTWQPIDSQNRGILLCSAIEILHVPLRRVKRAMMSMVPPRIIPALALRCKVESCLNAPAMLISLPLSSAIASFILITMTMKSKCRSHGTEQQFQSARSDVGCNGIEKLRLGMEVALSDSLLAITTVEVFGRFKR